MPLTMGDIRCDNPGFTACDFGIKSRGRHTILLVVIITPTQERKALFFLQEGQRWTLMPKRAFQKEGFPTFYALTVRGNRAARACDTEREQQELLDECGLSVDGVRPLL